MIISSLIFGMINGNAQEVLTAGLNGAGKAVTVCIGFSGMMCFWSGVLALSEKSGVSDALAKLLSPVLGRVFGKDNPALPHIVMNITANMLGMGNAATPAGISAMKELDKENNSAYPDRKMAVFAVMNTASVQIIPTTVISMRAASGSENPFAVLIPIWITSVISLIFAVTAAIYIQGGVRDVPDCSSVHNTVHNMLP